MIHCVIVPLPEARRIPVIPCGVQLTSMTSLLPQVPAKSQVVAASGDVAS